jgi:predicted TIM-barrel fold metal-dependent hydrolase
MAIPGDPHDAPLIGLHEAALRRAGVELDFYDAHTHLGQNDPDGLTATPEEILAALDRGGQRRALIFPMQEPDGYAGANDAAITAAEASDGRLLALARLDPNLDDEALTEGARAMAAGARGFKLHPRSDRFDMPHPVVDRIVALAHEHRAPVLFHAGRGFPGLGEEVAQLAARYPDARLILAHAGISDIGHLADVVEEAPNIFFDTSWWLVGDMLTLFTSVPPGRILYGSDMPYGAARIAALRDLRCAFEVGLEGEVLQSIAGGQLERIMAGEDPADFGPAPTVDLGPRDLARERAISYLTAAAITTFLGGDATEPLSLARLAVRYMDGPVGRDSAMLIDYALELAGEGPPVGVDVIIAAQLVLGTPAAS